jgi:hypothetical protein
LIYSPQMSSTSRVLNTELVFDVALEAAKSISAPPRTGGQRSALISIVFAAMSLEAFLNELIELAQDYGDYMEALPAISSFAQLMSDLEKVQGSVETRFNMAHWLLTGRPFAKAEQPFQNFKLLFQLRNDLMHFKPDPRMEEAGPKPAPGIIAKLHGLSILNDSPAPDSNRSWVHSLGTRAVAEWACNTSSRMTADMVSKLPESGWRHTVEDVTKIIRTLHFPARH